VALKNAAKIKNRRAELVRFINLLGWPAKPVGVFLRRYMDLLKAAM